jgi:hypothetical protein
MREPHDGSSQLLSSVLIMLNNHMTTLITNQALFNISICYVRRVHALVNICRHFLCHSNIVSTSFAFTSLRWYFVLCYNLFVRKYVYPNIFTRLFVCVYFVGNLKIPHVRIVDFADFCHRYNNWINSFQKCSLHHEYMSHNTSDAFLFVSINSIQWIHVGCVTKQSANAHSTL